MWVSRVAKWPPARVATQPPRVENSNDCGKQRSVRPRSRSWSSSTGPGAPAWIRAARETLVDLEHPVEPAEVDRDGAGILARQPRLDPAADAGAAAVGDRGEPLVAAPREHRLDLRLVARAGRRRRARSRTARESRGRRRGRPCRARGSRANAGRRRRSPTATPAPATRAAGSSARSSGTGSSDVLTAEPDALAHLGARRLQLLARDGCADSRPQPQCLRRSAATNGCRAWPARTPAARRSAPRVRGEAPPPPRPPASSPPARPGTA